MEKTLLITGFPSLILEMFFSLFILYHSRDEFMFTCFPNNDINSVFYFSSLELVFVLLNFQLEQLQNIFLCFRFCEKKSVQNKNIINNAMKGENFLTSCHSECGCVRLQKIDLQNFYNNWNCK